jgi:hypothetical protein
LPDAIRDRPDQNAGYDDAVARGPARDTEDALETESLERPATDDELSDVDDDINVPADPDEAAARDATREVRRRERSNR